jgi:23S rRNA (uracil1939-C5)-methyltransferase
MQHVEYTAQTAWKEQWLRTLFQEFGDASWQPFIASADPFPTYFRNKIRFGFVARDGIVWPSRHGKGETSEDIPADICYLQSARSMGYVRDTALFATLHGWTPYDAASGTGWLKHLLIREGKHTGEAMVSLVVSDVAPVEEIREWAAWLKERHDSLSGIFQSVTLGRTNNDPADTLLLGTEHIHEMIGTQRFRISLHSFFQTNSGMVGELYQAIGKTARLAPPDTLWDLYAGSATIGIFLASQAGSVLSVESNPQNTADAQANLQENNVQNLEVLEGDVESVCAAGFLETRPKPTVIVLDPPRAGLSANFRRLLPAIDAERIVYVSCNPATCLRETRELAASGYRVSSIQGADMFPHALHCEMIVGFEKA